MTQNDEKSVLEKNAAEVSAEATQILERATHESVPTLAQRQASHSHRPTQAEDNTKQRRKRGRPRAVRDPIILARLGQELSMPRKIKGVKNDASRGANDVAESVGPGGGIPPESTGAGKIFGNEEEGASPTLPKKNSEKKIKKLPVNQQPFLQDADALIRARLTSSVRDARLRQLFDLMVQNPGLKMNEAMTVLGYPPTAFPGKIVKQKLWQTLVSTYFPDEMLAERETFLLFHEDPRFVNASLDRIHKIKGSFQHVQTNVNVNIDGEVRQMSDSKLYEILDTDVIEGETTENNSNAD